MNKRTWITGCAAALIGIATLVVAQAPAAPKPTTDAQLDKIREQNEQILQKQDDILKKIDEMSHEIAQIRRRTS